ncbi:MAG: hypothetical protein HY315_07340 [Acidobacteria bacterium]|nr:hypothetical protein [Acidobacteriota bacterium]
MPRRKRPSEASQSRKPVGKGTPPDDDRGAPPEREEGRPCPCQCNEVDTVSDRIIFGGRQIYFNFKIRTFCGMDRKRGPDGELAPPVRRPFPLPGSGLGPPTRCYWTIKFWRDQSDGEPQSDNVWVDRVEVYPGLGVPVQEGVPQNAELQRSYVAPYGCESAELQVFIEIGDRQGEILNYYFPYKFRGCRFCLQPRQGGEGGEFGG